MDGVRRWLLPQSVWGTRKLLRSDERQITRCSHIWASSTTQQCTEQQGILLSELGTRVQIPNRFTPTWSARSRNSKLWIHSKVGGTISWSTHERQRKLGMQSTEAKRPIPQRSLGRKLPQWWSSLALRSPQSQIKKVLRALGWPLRCVRENLWCTLKDT